MVQTTLEGMTMAGQTRQPSGAENAAPLDPSEIVDTADNAVPGPAPDLSGKRVRAIPGAGGTTVLVRRQDFKQHGIDHGDVQFDFRVDRFTLPVGKDKALSTEAADFLTKNFPQSFEYLDTGSK
jgi:hypothetical protein